MNPPNLANLAAPNHIRNYLFLSFARLFFTFFIVLFFISAIVALISISNVTMVVKISFADLLKMYLYLLPNSFFFILPLTFFAASVLALSKLSHDYELLVFFSLGISPNAILRAFAPLSLLVGATLLVYSLAIIPLSSSAYRNFIDEKKANIDVNIKSGEFGQKLGDWLVYVEGAKDRSYDNLALFSSKGLDFESFILAQKGNANSRANLFELNLRNGAAYFADEKDIKKIVFENMIVRNALNPATLKGYDLLNYWRPAFDKKPNKITRKFSQAILISLFPPFSLPLLALFGVANPRFHKNLSYLYIIAAVVVFYALVYAVSEYFPLSGIAVLLVSWGLCGYFLYRRFILRFY